MIFQGLYTALLTPFSAQSQQQQAIDYAAWKRLLDLQIAAGVQGVVVCGSTGEASTMSMEEHMELIRYSVEHCKNKIQVIAGSGSNSTATAIELSRAAESFGVDGLLVVNPYYNNPTQEGLCQHFLKIADHVKCPIILYNSPSRTTVNISLDVLLRLAEHPNIVGIKEASGNFPEIIEKKAECPADFAFLGGDDNVLPAIMGLGAVGLISVISNLYPKPIKKMVAAYLQCDFASGNLLFYQYVRLMNALFIETNPAPVKAAAHTLHLCEDQLRLPLVSVSKDNRHIIENLIAALSQTSCSGGNS